MRSQQDEVAAAYLNAAELGDRLGVSVCFEVHVNMWSEHFGPKVVMGPAYPVFLDNELARFNGGRPLWRWLRRGSTGWFALLLKSRFAL